MSGAPCRHPRERSNATRRRRPYGGGSSGKSSTSDSRHQLAPLPPTWRQSHRSPVDRWRADEMTRSHGWGCGRPSRKRPATTGRKNSWSVIESLSICCSSSQPTLTAYMRAGSASVRERHSLVDRGQGRPPELQAARPPIRSGALQGLKFEHANVDLGGLACGISGNDEPNRRCSDREC